VGAGCEERIRVIKRVTGGKRGGGGDVEEDWLKSTPLYHHPQISLSLSNNNTQTRTCTVLQYLRSASANIIETTLRPDFTARE
jgi:hypothetical protein